MLELALKPKKNDEFPIAKTTNSNYLYITSDDPKNNVKIGTICPHCDKKFSTAQSCDYHIKNACKYKSHENNNTKYHIMLDNDEEFQRIPTQDREILYISGPPKCGKSFWLNEYCKKAHDIYGKKIILFSSIPNDDTLEKNKDMYLRVLIDNDMLVDPYMWTDFEDTVVVFDDIENARFPKVVKYLYELMNDIIKNGRHCGKFGTTIIFTNQVMRNGQKSKCILENASAYVIFPSVSNVYHTTNLLKLYCGVCAKGINYLRNSQCKWAIVETSVPRNVLTNKECYILDKFTY